MNEHETMIDIYVHTNRVTGKSYVGQTCRGMDHRWKGHCRSAGKCDFLFANAIHKHGPESFEHRLLMQCETQDEADDMEDFFIQELKTLAPNGYNLKGGGSRGRPSEKTRQKISVAGKGRKLSEETKRKMSAAAKDRSAEYRRKISESLKGRKHSEEAKLKMRASAKDRPPITEETRRNISAGAKLREAKKRQTS